MGDTSDQFSIIVACKRCSCIICLCVSIPYEGAGDVEGTHGVWYSQVVTEEHQRDEGTVRGALTHIHIHQRRSLHYVRKVALGKQHSSHNRPLRRTMVDCVEVAHGWGVFSGDSYKYYNQVPRALDCISRTEEKYTQNLKTADTKTVQFCYFSHRNSWEGSRQRLWMYVRRMFKWLNEL